LGAKVRATEAQGARPGDTVEALYQELRDLIVQGAFAPNERLTHAELSERFGVGRTPVRQALHRLEADGLVVSSPNRGVRVAPTAIAYAEELYAARLILEPPLMAALAGTLTQDELARMHGQLDRMEATIDRIPDFQVAHRDFHLVAAADYSSPFIADLVIRVHRHLVRHQQIYMSRPHVPADILALDRSLLDALEQGDAAAARHVYEFHLIELALGMVLDVDPDHAFDVLLRVAAANDIVIEATPEGRIVRPAKVSWNRSVSRLPSLRTASLSYERGNSIR
jgi:DNA-binding GntR family transcriptional regulator